MTGSQPAQPTVPVPSATDELGVAEGWVVTKLSTVCTINPPRPPADLFPPDTPVTFVPMPAVDAGLGAIVSPSVRPFAEARRGYTAFRTDDVIMAKITPCMENGKAAIARNLENGLGFGSTEFHVLRSSGAVLPEYLFHFLRQESFRKAAEAEMTGSVGQKRVPASFLEEVEIPLPPLAEQKRIVAKVEELLARANAARERLARVPAILKRFRQAVLAAACSGRLTEDFRSKNDEMADDLLAVIEHERRDHQSSSRMSHGKSNGDVDPTSAVTAITWEVPEAWTWVDLSKILHYDRTAAYGVLQPGDHIEGGVPFVRVCDIQNGTIHADEIKRIDPTIARQYRRTKLEGGEVLVTLAGTIGRTAVVPVEMAGANVARAVTVLPLCPNVVPEYVRYALEQYEKNNELVDLAREVARKTLNLGLLKAVKIPLAPLSEQWEIVQRVRALFDLADTIERRVRTGTIRAERLNQATLAKAFRGELVPTDAELARAEGRPYEPASALLDRIRSTQTAGGSPSRGAES